MSDEGNPCETHAEVQTPGGYCPVCLYHQWKDAEQRAEQAEADARRLVRERNDTRIERDEAWQEAAKLREALDRLYRNCNNVPIRGEGLHRGPIWFGQIADVPDEYVEDNNERYEALEQADKALQSAPPASEPEDYMVGHRKIREEVDRALHPAPADRPVGHTPDREYDMEDYAGVEDRPFNDEKSGWNEDMARLASDRPEPSDKGVLECPECGIESVHTWEDGWRCPRCGELHSPTSGAAEYGATADDVRIWLDEAIDLTADRPEPSEALEALQRLSDIGKRPEPYLGQDLDVALIRQAVLHSAPAHRPVVPQDVFNKIGYLFNAALTSRYETPEQLDDWHKDIARQLRHLSQPAPAVPINVVFDGPPGPTAGRFVEVETDDGRSVRVGEWIKRDDGLWALRIERALAKHPADGDSPAVPDGMEFHKAMQTCQLGLEVWRSKPHNKKWWKRIDGTPIPNDLLVEIAMQFAAAPTPTDDGGNDE